MYRLAFATGNARKVLEASTALMPFQIELIAKSVQIDEIQHHDSKLITIAKGKAAYQALQEPVVVNDTSWSIPALSGFPGGYMKDVAGWWTPQDWLALMQDKVDRSIICHEHIAFYDGHTLKHFQTNRTGFFEREVRGNVGNSMEKVVNLYGDGTFSELHEKLGVASHGKRLEHWDLFGQWYLDYCVHQTK